MSLRLTAPFSSVFSTSFTCVRLLIVPVPTSLINIETSTARTSKTDTPSKTTGPSALPKNPLVPFHNSDTPSDLDNCL
ncbi:hypothetical protein AX774_g5637 [Zancudomyces culisetae]|uniref:Uncharacterized protein n=1 Tax=Zancudomyces culisetae TaxID=1213189 RepID=A0A1R1PIY0_ZANCU|nr:hypothetical protein AX774_g5637 [Zancudomyces culisetae]|eukprot:OMH80916.1 hypothetical protein AX774_g5637 [Zancudomyces culisetae]